MINNKIKAFLKLKEIKNIDYSNKLNLSNSQALNTKFIRNSFKLQDIIILAEIANCEVALIDKATKQPIIIFDNEDLKEFEK